MKKLLVVISLVSLLSPLSALALFFDRSNDYVNIPGTLSIPANTFTISMWVKLSSASLTDTVFGQSNTAGSFVFRVDDDLSISAVITGTIIATTNNSIITENAWHFIAYSRSGTGAGTHKIYLDGVSQALVIDSATNYTATANAKQIGQRGDNASFSGGLIDEVRIYNRALMPGEVRMLYRKGNVRNGLIGYWPLIGNTSIGFAGGADIISFEPDFSGYRNHGTRTGGPVRAALSPTSRWRR